MHLIKKQDNDVEFLPCRVILCTVMSPVVPLTLALQSSRDIDAHQSADNFVSVFACLAVSSSHMRVVLFLSNQMQRLLGTASSMEPPMMAEAAQLSGSTISLNIQKGQNLLLIFPRFFLCL